MNYFDNLSLNQDDNDKLYAGIDIDNAIDIYLLINLIQGLDYSMKGSNIKNLYLAIKIWGERTQRIIFSLGYGHYIIF